MENNKDIIPENIHESEIIEWDEANPLPAKKEFIDMATEIADAILETYNKRPTFVYPTSSSGILFGYITENDRIDIRIGDASYVYINYRNNRNFEEKYVPFSMEYLYQKWKSKKFDNSRRTINEPKDRVNLSYPLLIALGFKKYETVIIKTNNYIKGHFKLNDALGRFSYKGEILPEIKYLDELCKIYFEKTGHSLKLNHKYGR